MSISTLYEGHYRMLEKDYLELVESILSRGTKLTVVAAGSGQLDRLREILLERTGGRILGGVRFLPGIRHLASELSIVPVEMETVSHADRTLFALKAMGSIKPGEPLYDLRINSETANSLGSFFETLFEHGVTPEIYEQTSMSLEKQQTGTEEVIGRIFSKYREYRSGNYKCCGDMIMEQVIPGEIDGDFVFYGFYDLNPSQRRFLKHFFKSASGIFWFSPVEENSQWKDIYVRTRRLLESHDVLSITRSGSRGSMNPFADFFEALHKQCRPSVPVSGFGITAVSGEMGASRTVLKRIIELNEKEGIPLSKIAVIRKKIEGGILIRLAHHEGVSTASPLKAKLVDIPVGELAINLASIDEGDFHYTLLEDLLTSGVLSVDLNPDPSEVLKVVESSGVRMGRENWRDWYASLKDDNKLGKLIRKLDEFFNSLPESATPAYYLRRLKKLFEEVAEGGISEALMETLFDPGSFRWEQGVSWKQFIDALRLHYRERDIVLRDGNVHGFQILPIEKARGRLFDSVIIMDMEEGIYPSPPIEDPRLTEEFRQKLQMNLKSEREIEDGYLLRQAGEAAAGTLDIIYRQRDAEGNDIYPSSFISNLVLCDGDSSPDPAWFNIASSSPLEQMLRGTHPGQRKALAVSMGEFPEEPFFCRSFGAESSRMDYSGFDCYDGIFRTSPLRKQIYSATMLEDYVRCPFAFLVKKKWNLEGRKILSISSSPDPLAAGSFVHETVEEIIRIHGFEPSGEEVIGILRKTANSIDLSGKLGTSDLEDIFLEKQKEIILQSLSVLAAEGWNFIAKEEQLQGCFGKLDIQGRIDLILEDSDGNLVVLDLKTGKLPQKREIEEGRYFQLPFYYRMMRSSYPERYISRIAYAGISMREPGKLTGYTGDDIEQIMDTAQKNAERIVGMMREGLFPPISTVNCDFCSFRGLCRRTPSQRIKSKVSSDRRMKLLKGMKSR